MITDGYTYALSFFRADGSAAGQVAVTPDWAPALECVHFAGIREGRLPAVTVAPPATVEPLWHTQVGEPYVSGFRVAIPPNGAQPDRRDDAALAGAMSREFPVAYFRGLAQQASAGLVEQGTIKEAEVFHYLVCAFSTQGVAPKPGVLDFAVEEVEQQLPLAESSLESYFHGAEPVGSFEAGVDVPVFIPARVLDEATALARAAGDVETGGVLVGRLHRDSSVPEIFIEVTALIPAQHTQSESTKLTFTAETWAAVRAALALRKRQEVMTGWFHYHPDFCRLRNCPEERRRACTASSAFFSADDVQLHRTIFERAYHIALLISASTAEGLTPSLYGWRHGVVAARGFHVLHHRAEAAHSRQLTVERHAS
jgi:proteasome lid subunit RPN8/RPN11